MLAIRHQLIDRLKNVKAITAGTVAFGVGLAGAAAYVGSGLVFDNFSYDAADPKASAKVAGASTKAETKASNDRAGTPGAGSDGSSASVAPSPSSTAGVSVAPSPSSTSTTPVVGGRGGGTAPTVTVAPTPIQEPTPVVTEPETCSCSLLDTVDSTVNTVDGTVEGTVDGLGL